MANQSPTLFRLARCAGLALSIASTPAFAANDAMMELLKILHEKGTLDEETYEALKVAAQADEEINAAAGADVGKKVNESLGQLGTPSLTPGRFEVKDKVGDYSWRVIGRMHLDAAFFDSDKNFVQTDDQQFRRLRLGVAGTMGTNWKYKAEYDFREIDTGISGLKDAYLDYVGPLPGIDLAAHPTSIKIGQSHEPFSFDLINSSNNSLFIERALPVNTIANFVGERNPGLKFSTLGTNWTAAFGAFATRHIETITPVSVTCRVPATGAAPGSTLRCTGTGGQEDTPPRDFNDGYAMTGRVTYAPWHDGGHVLHLGTSFSFRDFLDGNAMRLRERFEVNETSTRLIDTGNFAARDFMRWNAELAMIEGPFTFQGEYLAMKVNTPTGDDPLFDGYYLSAGWFLTGESRLYNFNDGIWDSTRPNRAFGKGGIGAWELVGRYSTVDLNDEALTGGQEKNITIGLNWYPAQNVRFMADYIRVLDLDGGTFDGAKPAAFVLRSQVFW